MAQRARIAPRKQAKQDRSRHTVEALLQATARVLSREGYDKASTNRIAEVAGVNIGSLYQYFPNKDALVAALIDRHIDELRGVMGASMTTMLEQPIPAAARAIVEAYLKLHQMDPALHKVLIEQVPRVEKINPMVRVRQAIVDVTRGFMAARRSEIDVDDVDLAAFVVVQAAEALIHAAILERPELLKDRRYTDQIVRIVTRYLGVEESAEAPRNATRRSRS